jgi:L-seryl-tRNA(Ser) seleniumtransferase
MTRADTLTKRYHLQRTLNAIGMPTIIGANVVPPEVRSVADEAMAMNVDIDALQAAACRTIAQWTGAEAGCVTACCASGIAVTTAAAMTGADLGRVLRLPDTDGMKNEVVMQLGHNLNFGGEVSQMVRLTGASLRLIGTANHCDAFHLRSAIGPQTAAVMFVENGAVHPEGNFIPLEECVAIAGKAGLPVIVDAAGEPDMRPFVKAGSTAVVTSAHKMMGAPTSGMICGQKDFIHATYLQNWGIGRAMKVGKEGIAGCMAAVERWYARDLEAEKQRFEKLAGILGEHLTVQRTDLPSLVEIEISHEKTGLTGRQFANALREGDPPIWVRGAHDHDGVGRVALSLSVMDEDDAHTIGRTIRQALENPKPPNDDVPFHDLYWSEKRLMRWPG